MFFSKIGFLLLFIPLAGYVAWYILRGRHLVPSIKVSTSLPYASGVKSYIGEYNITFAKQKYHSALAEYHSIQFNLRTTPFAKLKPQF